MLLGFVVCHVFVQTTELMEQQKAEEIWSKGVVPVQEEEHDVKLSGIHPEGGYAQGLFDVRDERWAEAVGKEGVHVFTEKDFPHEIPQRESDYTQLHLGQLRLALDHLKLIKEGKLADSFVEGPDAFLQEVLDYLPSDETMEFRAGGLTRNWWVWEEFLGIARKKRPEVVKWIRDSLRHGVRWDVVTPVTQKDMPLHKQKLERAVKALSKQFGMDEAWGRMKSDKPEHCAFPNHPSADEFEKELSEKLEEYKVQGVVRRVPDGKQALVGCSLGGVQQGGKVRPIIDPLVTNLYLKYQGVKYEKLADVCDYAPKGGWATTTDEKSGYHHIPLHPDMWNLLGFSWKGENYVFTHVPFGVGPACRTYTVLKQEVYRVVREVGGVDLTHFIDDMMAVAESEQMALFQLATILRLLGALGFTVSKKKLQLPAQKVKFLGLLVDILCQKFWVPEEKVQEFKRAVDALKGQEQLSNRQLAKLAGKLVSFKLAVGLAPLYAQLLFKAQRGELDWDQLYDSPQSALGDLVWFADHLELWNGKGWVNDRQQVLMAGDYGSNTGFGAWFPNGEMAHIEHSLTPEQVQRVQDGELSSTEGELLALLYALQTVLQVNPGVLVGKTLHYQSDNQGTVADVNGMKGNAAVLPVVKKIWDTA